MLNRFLFRCVVAEGISTQSMELGGGCRANPWLVFGHDIVEKVTILGFCFIGKNDTFLGFESIIRSLVGCQAICWLDYVGWWRICHIRYWKKAVSVEKYL